MGRPSKLNPCAEGRSSATARRRRGPCRTRPQLRCGQAHDFEADGMKRAQPSQGRRRTTVVGIPSETKALVKFTRSDPVVYNKETLDALVKELFDASDRVTAV